MSAGNSAPVGFFVVGGSLGRVVVWTDDEGHAASLVADLGPGYRVRPAMVQAVADKLLFRFVAGGGNLLDGRRLLVEIVSTHVEIGTIAEALEYHGFATDAAAVQLALDLVAPVEVEGVQR